MHFMTDAGLGIPSISASYDMKPMKDKKKICFQTF